ncbi:MAG: sce7726 family protein, partial [Betaproteobacteria bacterium]|nr:sce7726 family protein [Betaproteobacteria bacterium]
MRKSKQLRYEAVQVVLAPAFPRPVGIELRPTTHPARADRALRELTKAEISRYLHKRASVVMVEEMEVCSGRARVDLAVISDQLIGIEIKSGKDDVTRLPAQAEAYSRCFDRVVLVVDESLVAKAAPLIPTWWGLVVTFQQDDRLTYVFERRPRRNPHLDLDALLALLWREEVAALLGDLLGISAQPR